MILRTICSVILYCINFRCLVREIQMPRKKSKNMGMYANETEIQL